MELKRYQWVGLLAGFPLFSGAWLSAFYDNYVPGLIGVALTGGALFMAVRLEKRSDLQEHIARGLVAGLLAGITARILGLVAAVSAGATEAINFGSLGDLYRVILAGDVLASLLLVLVIGSLGITVAALEPEAKGRR